MAPADRRDLVLTAELTMLAPPRSQTRAHGGGFTRDLLQLLVGGACSVVWGTGCAVVLFALAM